NQSCGQRYEETRCYRDGCNSVFTPEDTKVVGEQRLIIEGVYAAVRRWGCQGTRYYRQGLCKEDITDLWPQAAYAVQPDAGGRHDHCPWSGCPQGNPRHAPRGRGTTLWVRAEWAGVVAPQARLLHPLTARRLQGLEEGGRRVLNALDEPSLERVLAA